MKSNLKTILLFASFAAVTTAITSCNGNSNERNEDNLPGVTDEGPNSGYAKTNPDENSANRNDNTNDNMGDKNRSSDAKFLISAAEINLKEIKLGELAQMKGTSSAVKELGKMMVDAHTKSQNDLTALANRKSITIPTSAADEAMDTHKKLSEKSGNDFDKAYSEEMVNLHQDAISKFEKAAKDSEDADIKSWASTSLPDLRKHHQKSIETNKKFADMILEKNN